MLLNEITKQKLYWLLQTAGWTLFYFSSGLIYAFNQGFSLSLFINLAINIVLMIGATHGIRIVVIRRNWLALPIYKMLLLFAGLSIILSVPLGFINIYLDHWCFAPDEPLIVGFAEVYDYSIHVFRNLAPWFSCYVLFIYSERYHQVRLKELEMKSEMFEIMISYYKNQLSPHFLFNSLNSLRTLITINPSLAEEVTNKLSLFLRKTIDLNMNDLVPVNSELEIVSDYLYLEHIRYKERLRFEMNCHLRNPETVTIPPMIIQTLVENAIKHGISKLRAGGFIGVSIYDDTDAYVIEVVNSGTFSYQTQEGVGLKNLRHRLKLLYGDKCVFTIASKDYNTVKATITIKK